MRGFVAELSNGQIIKEDTIYNDIGLFSLEKSAHNLRPWVLLKKYIKSKNLKLVGLHLQYDHQGIFLPRHARAYFFSRKVEGYLGADSTPKQYTGIGATEHKNDEVVITWFDGDGSTQEKRKVDVESPQFITN